MTKQEKIALVKSLRDLQGSVGWQAICNSLDASALDWAYTLGSDPNEPKASIDFKRGAIHAFKALKGMPERLASVTDAEIMIENSKEVANA